MVTLAEELLLLAFDEESGRNKAQYLEKGLAGALLLDLVYANRMYLSKRRLGVANATPVGNRLLDEFLQQAAGAERYPHAWLSQWHWGARWRVADALASQGVLRLERDRVLKVFPFARYRAVRPQVAGEVRGRLKSAMVNADWDVRTAALGGLVYAMRMERRALPDLGRWRARRRLRPVAKGRWTTSEPAARIQPAHSTMTTEILKAVAASSKGYGDGVGGGDGGDGGGE